MTALWYKTYHYKLYPEADEGRLLLASALWDGELKACSGLITRQLVRHRDGSWTDTSYWRSRRAAHSDLRLFEGPAFIRMVQLIDPRSLNFDEGAAVEVPAGQVSARASVQSRVECLV